MDVFIRADAANALALYEALAEFGPPLKTSARSTLKTATISFDLDASREGSIFFPIFLASILTRHGSGGLKP
jgi:hypothetical protein